jgi:hypothetical protein
MQCDHYFERFGFCPPQLQRAPNQDLGLVVVIPCHNEPELLGSLDALWACTRPECAVEVIVVINSAEDCAVEVRERNEFALRQANAWAEDHEDARLVFHFLNFPRLPRKHAGVGLARKIGMDEALRRFDRSGQSPAGVLACFDADCQCDSNYLTALVTHFGSKPGTPGCSIYFEHPLLGPLPQPVYDAVAAYELHLRYYVQALRFACFPHAHHTVGSAMAVRALVYKAQGGMNKRQAGEDFYFLQKVIALGEFTDLTTTRVIPSPRPSRRVPFGTGRAICDALAGSPHPSYAWEAFLDLKQLFGQIAELQTQRSRASIANVRLSDVMRAFLIQEDFEAALDEMRANSASLPTFRKRFFAWFGGFRVMKFVHFARDRVYGPRGVEIEAGKLLDVLNVSRQPKPGRSLRETLACYRELDRRPFQP